MENEKHGYRPTTTHAEWGAGRPHLLITSDDAERFTYPITVDEMTIGSAAGNTLSLAGSDPLHATIVHDERDEYVLTMHGEGNTNASSLTDDGTRTEILRTGAQFTIGRWRFVFRRDEYADHGRPYGGREGGELSDQQSQPARPDYRHGEKQPPHDEVRDG